MGDYYPEMHTDNPDDLVEIITALRQRVGELQQEQAWATEDILSLLDRVAHLEEEKAQLREGLRFYANPDNYQDITASQLPCGCWEFQPGPISDDEGALARSLLNNDSGSAGVCEPIPERGSPDEAAPALNIEEG